MQILVTGADGFIGRRLCSTLETRGLAYRRAFRLTPKQPPAELAAQTVVAVGSVGPNTDWTDALAGITTVVHLAARVHVLNEHSADSLAEFRRVNVAGTERLARLSAQAGVRRLVYISTVKVHGDATGDSPLTEAAPIRPRDAYGISKLEAEQSLQKIAAQTGLEVAILRPPLVYGPGVKGNFLRLTRLIARGVPLPLAAVANRRSLIYVGNLIDAIISCVDAPAAAGKTYLVSDGEDLSTPELIKALAIALGVRARLVPCPVTLLELGASVLGKTAEIARLTSSLQVDCSRIRTELGWQPRYSLTQGLGETARWFKSREPRIVNAVGEQLPRPDDGDA